MKSIKYLPNKDVAARYGVTTRTVDNWLAKDELDFPKPILINGRKLYPEHELDEFDRRAARGGAGEPKAA
jgi:predicted DNA-binding transcriptional regulator AlpA